MDKLRVGILGAGKMGKVYVRWFSDDPHCEVAGIYNRTRQRAQDLAAGYSGARVFDTWQSLVNDPGIDIIGICTPSHEHLDQFRAAANAGKHVLCEKPMAKDLAECRQMVELSRTASTKVMVGFQMRFHPVVRTVDKLISAIGRIYHMDFVFGLYRPGNNWRFSITQGGGVLKELSSHLIDLMCHWLGPMSSVTGVNKIIDGSREVEDYSLALMEFAGGASGYLFSSYLDQRGPQIKGNIMGMQGQIGFQFSSYDPSDSRVVVYRGDSAEGVTVRIPEQIDEVYPGHLDSFQKEIGHFVRCILDGEQPLVSAVDGCNAIEVIDASYESTRTGHRVRLPLNTFDSGQLQQCFQRFSVGSD